MLGIILYIFGMVVMMLMTAIWNAFFVNKYIFDVALFGVTISMCLWIMLIISSLFSNWINLFSYTVGFFTCFSTWIILMGYRKVRSHKFYQYFK